jgi:hypothetical protein
VSREYKLREEGKRQDELLARPEVREAMKIRCELEGHSDQNCIGADFGLFSGAAVYQMCQWCGRRM